MNPQVLGNLTTLAQKTQQANQAALLAQQMALNATSAASAAQTAVSSSPVGEIYTPILTAVSPFVNVGTATAWRTISAGVPVLATAVEVSGWANFSQPDNAQVQLQFRRDSSDSALRLGCKFQSVNGTYSGAQAFSMRVPLTSSGTFDYQIYNGSFGSIGASVTGYWS